MAAMIYKVAVPTDLRIKNVGMLKPMLEVTRRSIKGERRKGRATNGECGYRTTEKTKSIPIIDAKPIIKESNPSCTVAKKFMPMPAARDIRIKTGCLLVSIFMGLDISYYLLIGVSKNRIR